MSNLLNFKFGQYANLPTSITAGNVYVTTDEKAMYVDLPNSEGVASRFRIGDIVVKNSVEDIEPPFYADAFYYSIEENALLRWNATGGEDGKGTWVQINKSKDLEGAVSALSTKVDGIDDRLEVAEQAIIDNKSAADTAIGNLTTAVEARVTTEAFNAFKDENDKAIADAEKAGTDAADAASAAQATANQAVTDAAEAKRIAETKTTLDAVKELGYATTAEAQGYANAVLGDAEDTSADKTVYGAFAAAAAASGAASAAQTRADSAYTLAEGKVDANWVEGKNYITIQPVNDLRTELSGTEGDTTGITIQRAITDAKAADAKAGEAAGAAQNAQDAADAAAEQAALNAKAIEDINKAGYITIDSVNEAKAEVLGTEADTADKNTVYGAKAAAAAAAQAAAAADSKAQAAQSTLTSLSSKVDTVESTANNALSKVNGGTMGADINMGGNAITNLKAPTVDADAATKKYVDSAIESKIAANDAMTFKGVVGGEGATLANLPTSGVQKGDTYKVGAIGIYNGQVAKVGDLFICTSEDNAEEVAWAHVSSGYEDDYLQKVGADEENATVYLTDGVNDSASQGGIKFVSENSGLKIEVVENEDGLGNVHTVKASFVWEEFTA